MLFQICMLTKAHKIKVNGIQNNIEPQWHLLCTQNIFFCVMLKKVSHTSVEEHES